MSVTLIRIHPKLGVRDESKVYHPPFTPFVVSSIGASRMRLRDRRLLTVEEFVETVKGSRDRHVVRMARNAGLGDVDADTARRELLELVDVQADPELPSSGGDPYAGLKRDEIRELCRERGLPVGGTRDELVARLVESEEAQLEHDGGLATLDAEFAGGEEE